MATGPQGSEPDAGGEASGKVGGRGACFAGRAKGIFSWTGGGPEPGRAGSPSLGEGRAVWGAVGGAGMPAQSWTRSLRGALTAWLGLQQSGPGFTLGSPQWDGIDSVRPSEITMATEEGQGPARRGLGGGSDAFKPSRALSSWQPPGCPTSRSPPGTRHSQAHGPASTLPPGGPAIKPSDEAVGAARRR